MNYNEYLKSLQGPSNDTTSISSKSNSNDYATSRLSDDEIKGMLAAKDIQDKSNAFTDGVNAFTGYLKSVLGVVGQGANALGEKSSSDSKFGRTGAQTINPNIKKDLQDFTLDAKRQLGIAEIGSPTASKVGEFGAMAAISAPTMAVGGAPAGIIGKTLQAAGQGALAGAELGAVSPSNIQQDGSVNPQAVAENTISGAQTGAMFGAGAQLGLSAVGAAGRGAANVTTGAINKVKNNVASTMNRIDEVQSAGKQFGVDINPAQAAGVEPITDDIINMSKTQLNNMVVKNASGDIVGLTGSVKKGLDGARTLQTQLWDKVQELSPTSVGKVNMAPLRQKVAELGDELGSFDNLSAASKIVVNRLNKLGDDTSFNEVRLFRQTLNKELSKIKTSSLTGTEYQSMKQLKDLLDDEITRWGNNVPASNRELVDAFQKANGFTSQYKQFLSDNKLKEHLINNATIETFSKKLLKQDNTEILKSATGFLNKYSNVGDEVVANKINMAFEKSTTPQGVIDTLALGNQLKNDAQLATLLKGTKQGETISQYSSLMTRLTRPVDPNTPPDITGIGNKLTSAGGLQNMISGWVFNKLATNEAFLDMLRKANGLPPQVAPPIMKHAVEKINKMVRNATVVYENLLDRNDK